MVDLRKLLIIFLLVFLWSCTSCNSKDPEIDDDTVSDKDSVAVTDSDVLDTDRVSDSDTVKDDSDTDSDLVETDGDSIEDKDIFPDEVPETDTGEWPDYDYPAGTEGDPDCPSLLNAGFPYVDKDGKKHFCRKCDLPAPENDPQCIRNLWEINNRKIIEKWPDYYCYPLPCDVTSKALLNEGPAYVSPCDIDAVSGTWHQSTGVFRQGDIYKGTMGMYAAASKKVDDKYIVIGNLHYEITTGKYTMIGWSDAKQAYNYDRFIFLTGNSFDLKSYIVSAKKVKSGWKYEFAYTDEWNRTIFIYPPAVGENYVLINVKNVDGNGDEDILYANVNDWNFKKLGTGTVLYPQMFDDVAIFVQNSTVWSCDLSKSPTNIETGCQRINQEGAKATAPAVNKQDHSKIIYSYGEGYYQLYMADLSGETTTYSKLDIEMSPDLISYAPSQWDGDIFVFEEMYAYSEVQTDYRICYYSFSKDRKVCFPNPDGSDSRIRSIYGGVEGKYIIWKTASGTTLRNMECYCKEHPEGCLYDEFLPNEIPDDDANPVFIY